MLLSLALYPAGFSFFTSAAEPEPVLFSIETAGGTNATGPLMELGADWRVKLGGAKGVHTDAEDLIELRRVGRSLPDYPDGEQLVLVNGDRIPASGIRVAGERAVFRPRWSGQADEAKSLILPTSALSLVWLATPEGVNHPDRYRRELLTQKRSQDTVHLRNGDLVEGVLSEFDDRALQIEVEKKAVDVKRERLAVVALNTELTTTLRPKGAYARVVLANGGRLSLASASCTDAKTLTGTTLFQAPVRIPLDEVIALYLYQGRAVYLSDLKPKQFEQTPFLPGKLLRPFVTDGNVHHGDLRLAGDVYDKGLGLHSRSQLTYEIAGQQRFEALVGLDRGTGRQGHALARVLVDGEVKWEKELTPRSGPLPVRINLAGAKALTLVVDFGQGGNVGDDVNWADARLVKAR